MVETSAIGKNWNLIWAKSWAGDLVCGVCINNEEWLKPLQSKTGTSIFKSWKRVDLVCGVCINNEEWLKPLQSAKTGTSMGRVGRGELVWSLRVGDLACGVCINNEEWLKPLQSAKTGTSIFKSWAVDLACGVCINNEEWLKPLQSKTGTSIKSWAGTSRVEFVLTTRNG
ncbi:hypothetical protein CEXT_546921 [Caerostris extrusa]|uniref:Uncharacterized protein n=1 Tax=Caerostris extrusa TaxID=172846 RepID=A0AAV4VJ04_CAEEX|nr:hypothetical protein CEXT_546921 [Caerostris extrusa]